MAEGRNGLITEEFFTFGSWRFCEGRRGGRGGGRCMYVHWRAAFFCIFRTFRRNKFSIVVLCIFANISFEGRGCFFVCFYYAKKIRLITVFASLRGL